MENIPVGISENLVVGNCQVGKAIAGVSQINGSNDTIGCQRLCHTGMRFVTIKGGVDMRWRCLICGYIHDGEQPPYRCPICGAPAKMFEQVAEKPSPKAKRQ